MKHVRISISDATPLHLAFRNEYELAYDEALNAAARIVERQKRAPDPMTAGAIDFADAVTDPGLDEVVAVDFGAMNTPQAQHPRREKVTWFDPSWDLHGEAGELLTQQMLNRVRRTGRGKRVKLSVLHPLIRMVTANGLRCQYTRNPPSVAHFRMANAYSDTAPECLNGRRLGRLLDELSVAGLVEVKIGRRHRISSYTVTDKLLALADTCGVTPKSLTTRVPDENLLLLYGPKPKRKRGQRKRPKGKREKFQPTLRTWQMTAELKAINAYLFEQEIELVLSPEEEASWAEALTNDQDRKGAPYSRPETFQTDMYRVFNNSSFLQGGRMYGAWWINVWVEFRPRITINGQKTVELDYAAFHPTMLYHERGLECVGDPYELPEITALEQELGLPPRTYRSCIKQYTNALINCEKGGRPSNITVEEGTVVPDFYRPIEIIRMIERRHWPIRSDFRSNAGLRLQRIDSDIAMDVITTAMNEGWVALPVHDSFITTEDQEERLREVMEDCYGKRFPFKIDIK